MSESPVERRTRLVARLRAAARTSDKAFTSVEAGGTALGAVALGIGGGLVSVEPAIGGLLLCVGTLATGVSLCFILLRRRAGLETAEDAVIISYEGERLRAEADAADLRHAIAFRDAELAHEAQIGQANRHLQEAHALSEKRNAALLLNGHLLTLAERFFLLAPEKRNLSAALDTVLGLLEQRYAREAFGFDDGHRWTLTIFSVEATVDGERLCARDVVRWDRSKDTGARRRWAKGEGWSGYAWDRGGKLVLPDTKDGGARNMAVLRPPQLGREGDDDLYRSITVVPLTLPGDPYWGQVVASSDQVGHFGLHTGEPLAQLHADAVVALAGVVTLLVNGTRQPTS